MKLQEVLRQYHQACRDADRFPKDSPQQRDAVARRRRFAHELSLECEDIAGYRRLLFG